MEKATRRRFLEGAGVAGAALLVGACSKGEEAIEVTAVEDLMREHGVIRRTLLVYQEISPKLKDHPDPVIIGELQKAAKLFRAFAEDYHERKLEEGYIFPALKKGKDAAISSLVYTLKAQHDRARLVTDYILALTPAGKIDPSKGAELAKILESLALMYENHAAREDTIIFPAWKQTMSAKELDEIGDKFEDIEHEQFGEDGFEKAVRQIAEIETALGLADIGQFTVPPPPQA